RNFGCARNRLDELTGCGSRLDDRLLGFQNLQQLGLMRRKCRAQILSDGPFRGVNDQAIVARGFYLDAFFAELGKQIMGCHSSITSRSVSTGGEEDSGMVAGAEL